MNLFELFVKIGVDDQASGKLKDLGGKLGNGLKTAAKIGTAAVGAAAAGITALTTAAVNNYAEYEQLVGGVETLFGKSADTVMKYAESAYKTAGLSANEYMATVTSFSASLLQSVGGDTEKAADYANRALTDMSDNANKMGTSMELIQNAYNGFAKANYTMLDNLKLGYGGTKEEMARLIKEAAAMTDVQKELGIAVDATDMSFGNIVNAISVVQKNMKITGTTADEAGRTISGSVGAMKAAWTNLVTGFADGSADIGGLIDNLVTTIVGDGTENNLGVIGNVLPAIERALGGIIKLVEGAAPKIIEILPGLVEKIVPSLISAATSLVGSLVSVLPDLLKSVTTALTSQSSDIIQTVLDVLLDSGKALVDNAPVVIDAIAQIIDELIMWVGEYSSVFGETAIDLIDALASGIVSNLPTLIETAIITIEYFAESLIEMLPQIVALGLDLIVSLANGIAESLPELIPTIIDVVLQIVDTLTNQESLTTLLNAAFTIVSELAWGLIENIDKIIDAVFTLLDGMIDFLLRPANLAMLIETAIELVLAIGVGIVKAIPQLLVSVGSLIGSIFTNFFTADWGSIGTNLVDGLKNGISNAWENLKEWFSGLFDDLIGIAKKILGIASPSKVFKKIGGFTAEGFGIGFDDEFSNVKKEMEKSMNFDDVSMGISPSIKPIYGDGSGKTNPYGNVSIVQNIYSEAKTAADLMQEALYQQERAVLLGV